MQEGPSAEELLNNDEICIKYSNQLRLKLYSSPSQSFFRVMAILVVRHDINDQIDGIHIETIRTTISIIHGSNMGPGYIGGSICAERSALCRLRFLENPVVKLVIITTDHNTPILPGALCREYLSSFIAMDTRLLMGNFDGTKTCKCSLQDVWTFPYIYRFQTRDKISQFCEEFKKHSAPISEISDPLLRTEIQLMYLKAIEINSFDRYDVIHPLRFSAAVMYENGRIERAWQLKGLEYGCTLDPVCQLIYDMEQTTRLKLEPRCACCPQNFEKSKDLSQIAAMEGTNRPKLVIFIDQYGTLHAPFAQARALLNEHGYHDVMIPIHNEEGQIQIVKVYELLPVPSGHGKMLTHDDFPT